MPLPHLIRHAGRGEEILGANRTRTPLVFVAYDASEIAVDPDCVHVDADPVVTSTFLPGCGSGTIEIALALTHLIDVHRQVWIHPAPALPEEFRHVSTSSQIYCTVVPS